jgi:hypothetical protein
MKRMSEPRPFSIFAKNRHYFVESGFLAIIGNWSSILPLPSVKQARNSQEPDAHWKHRPCSKMLRNPVGAGAECAP